MDKSALAMVALRSQGKTQRFLRSCTPEEIDYLASIPEDGKMSPAGKAKYDIFLRKYKADRKAVVDEE